MDAEGAWLRTARALRFQVPAFHSLGAGQTATRGTKLFTWNWSPLATAAVQPNRRCLDQAEVTLYVLLEPQE
jgi:hypothetical protein